MGGRTALLLGVLEPSIVNELIVVDSSPIHATTKQGMEVLQTFLNALLNVDLNCFSNENMKRSSIKKHLNEKLKENGIKSESLRQWLLMSLSSQLVNGKEEYGWNFNLKILRECLRPNLVLLPQDVMRNDAYKNRTLFIGSGLSNYIPRDSHDKIRRIFPLAEFVYVEGAGHWVQADKPKEFLEIVLRFLS